MNSTRLVRVSQAIRQNEARRLLTQNPSNLTRFSSNLQLPSEPCRSFATSQSTYIKRNPFEQEMVRHQTGKTSPLASLNRFLVSNLFRHTSVFTSVMLLCAVGFGVEYDAIFDYLWKQHNKGKLFEHVIPVHFAGTPPNCDDEGQSEDLAGEEGMSVEE